MKKNELQRTVSQLSELNMILKLNLDSLVQQNILKDRAFFSISYYENMVLDFILSEGIGMGELNDFIANNAADSDAKQFAMEYFAGIEADEKENT